MIRTKKIVLLSATMLLIANTILLIWAQITFQDTLWDWNRTPITWEEAFPPWPGPLIIGIYYLVLWLGGYVILVGFIPKIATNENLRIIAVYGGFFIYILLLIIGTIVAYQFSGYLPLERSISSMATYRRSNFPWIYDIACFFGGIMTLFLLHSNKLWFERKIQFSNKPNLRILLKIGLVFGFIGSFSYPMIGIWSSERDLYNELHSIVTLITFGGFILNAIFFGILLLILKKGGAAIATSTIALGLIPISFLLYYLDIGIGNMDNIFEWILLLCILLWMISISIFSLWSKKDGILS